MSTETKQNELIMAALLTSIDLTGNTDPTLKNILDTFQKDWKKLEGTAASDKVSQQQKDDIKPNLDALAKGLPAIASGVRDAVTCGATEAVEAFLNALNIKGTAWELSNV